MIARAAAKVAHDCTTPWRCEDAPRSIERNVQPGRPVRQLVFDFVKRLFEQEEIEQVLRLRRSAGHSAGSVASR